MSTLGRWAADVYMATGRQAWELNPATWEPSVTALSAIEVLS